MLRTYGRVADTVTNFPVEIITTTGLNIATTFGPILVEAPYDSSLPEVQEIMRWIKVTTTPAGFNDYVHLTTLIQTMKLELGESPFYGNSGIPAKPTIVQQIAPDFYATRIQQQFAQYFANLTIARVPAPDGYPPGTPTYNVAVTTNEGLKLSVTVPISN